MSDTSSSTRAGALGLIAGFVGGLLGVGGGVIMVPGLVLWAALDQRRAAAASLAAIIAAAGAATVRNGSAGLVDWGVVGLIFVGGGLGAFAGARLLDRVPIYVLARMFVVVLLVAAARLAFG